MWACAASSTALTCLVLSSSACCSSDSMCSRPSASCAERADTLSSSSERRAPSLLSFTVFARAWDSNSASLHCSWLSLSSQLVASTECSWLFPRKSSTSLSRSPSRCRNRAVSCAYSCRSLAPTCAAARNSAPVALSRALVSLAAESRASRSSSKRRSWLASSSQKSDFLSSWPRATLSCRVSCTTFSWGSSLQLSSPSLGDAKASRALGLSFAASC
mmetsp:Transcript_33903/g.60314  ORF Transcript_33903/g.60314 Transcript_33903/m.60314 type:complete len:217 (+) Transcript_33903:35-685(+)